MDNNFLNDLSERPIFICGHPKAGTSLVRSILDSHPQLVVYPEETLFFRKFLPEAETSDFEKLAGLIDKRLIQIFTWNNEAPPDSQDGYPDRDYSLISFEEIQKALHQRLEQNYTKPGDILSAAMLAYGLVTTQISSDTRYWVEKSPYNEYYADQIYAWWPEARCIHVLRDPRDNYTSYRRKHPDWPPEFFAGNWVRSTKAGMQNRDNHGTQRYMLLRYEDLVQFPQKTIQSMLEFLEIDWDPTLTTPTRAGQTWQGNSMFSDAFSGISAAPINRWKGNLNSQDVAVIEMMTSPLIESCGYDLDEVNNRFSLSARWRVLSWPIRKRLRLE